MKKKRYLSQSALAARLGVHRETLARDRGRKARYPVPDAFVDDSERPLYSLSTVERWEAKQPT